jgi:beta-glucanase (GH16 family)
MTCWSFGARKARASAANTLFSFVVAGALLCGAGNARGAWRLVWSDEFDGGAVDAHKWSFDTGNGSHGWGNDELEYYTSRSNNVYVADGLLHILAQKEPYQGCGYTSAKLKSSGLFSQKYGRFEFQARLPQGQGFWPALWMMPEKPRYGAWAASGEIDVMENKGANPTSVLGTIHFGGTFPHQVHSCGPAFQFTAGDSVTNFHLYAIEWTTNAIRWYVDSHLYETQTNWWSSGSPVQADSRNPYPAPFDQPFHIIMNLAVGGRFGGDPDTTTAFPGEMQVDYVRIYEWAPAEPAPPIFQSSVPLDDSAAATAPGTRSADITLQTQ